MLVGVALALLMHWPLPLHIGSDVPKDLGDPLPQAWQIAWGGHALQHQPLDYWQSNMYYPLENTLAFSDALAGYAPFGLIGEGFQAAIVRYNLLFLFAYALAFVGPYLLARELGLGRAAGAVAGVAYAYAPWRLEQDGHLHVISSGGIPLAVFLLVRGYRRGSARTVLAGWLVAAWQLALGFTLGLMLAYLLAALAVVLLLRWRKQRPSRKLLAVSGAGAAVFLCVGLLLAMPYQAVKEDHPESERTAETVAAFSGGPEMFLAAPEQSTVWGSLTSSVRDGLDFVPEQTLFPGVLVFLLGALGVSRLSPLPRRLRIGLGAGVVGLAVLSLGFQTPSGGVPYPYRALYELAPGWDAVRTPGRLNTLTSLGLALLAAAGAHGLLARGLPSPGSLGTRLGSQRIFRKGVAFALPALVLLEGAGFPVPHPTVAEPPPGLAEATPPRLHLPMYEYESRRFLLWSADGFPEIVNGRGSFKPEFFDDLEHLMASFPDRRAVEVLERIGVRTVVLHPDIVDGTPWEGWRRWPLRGTATGGVVLYRLNTGR
ncbi:MAG: hypothetical protein QOJ22_257 [Thermoleophilaceae bacterium]|nr:hypothetical protein [Thermoleophilaceae bacterium]